jgi:poly(hydroxyalkanoate) depolymerase family esterase
MPSGLRRYEFSERLADILGESRRDLRFRVTMMVMDGLVSPGPRGRGSPPATPQYAANLLLGAMAAPQQVHTVEAIRCYRELQPTAASSEVAAPRVTVGPPQQRVKAAEPPVLPLLFEQLPFGAVLMRLLDLAQAQETRDMLAGELFGLWVSRGFPVAGLQIGSWSKDRRTVITRRYELPEGSRPPAWLDPARGGVADPGLLHTVFLPVSKLIAIGALTTFPDKRSSEMINFGPKMASIANLASLARQPRFRRSWEKLLSTLGSVQAWTNSLDSRDSRLVEVTNFGSNPGELRMLTYVPEILAPSPALVVLLHGCTQTAASYDKGTGWSTLADRFGFALLLPQQQWTNNPLRCFNWFRGEDSVRDAGEPLSVKQMIERTIADHGIDRARIYVTGLSSGGAMTSVMLATYPDLFAGGAVIAGVPYRSANGLQEAFESIFQGRSRPGREWGDLVRTASSHDGPWPKVSVWHGDADSSVKPMNAEETIKQWVDVHGLHSTPTIEKTVNGHSHRVWRGPDGEHLIESYTITGMSHGAPLEPGAEEHQCGTVAPFFNDVGLSSTYHIARFWGLPEMRPEVTAADHRYRDATATCEPAPMPSSAIPFGNLPTIYVDSHGRASADEIPASGQAAPDSEAPPRGWQEQGIDVQGIINKSLEAAGLFKGSGDSASEAGKASNAPLGIDVQGIISKSLEAAGLFKGSGHSASEAGKASSAPLGIDVQGIISKSLEAAGQFGRVRGVAPDSTPPSRRQEGSDWEGEGWQLLADDPHAFSDSPLLFGRVSSGNGCDVGNKVRSISRRLALGHRPELSYVRRVNLSAGVNDYTRARFSVLVDGLTVDEVSAVGMEHTETEWQQRSGIDLAPFANRTVTITFEVAANSNVCSEVVAKAWVERIKVREAAAVAAGGG